MTDEYRVTQKAIRRSRSRDDEETFEVGDTFEPTDQELDAFGDRLEPVEEEFEVAYDEEEDEENEEVEE